MSWNFACVIEALSRSEVKGRNALIHDDVCFSYGTLGSRARAIASWLLLHGVGKGQHVGFFLRNSNVYLEMFVGAGLVSATHVNINFRYTAEELVDLASRMDLAAIVYDSEFAEAIDAARGSLSSDVLYLEHAVGQAVNDFAVCVHSLYETPSGALAVTATGEDLIIIATGGTTGAPKGTQWKHEDLWFKQAVSTGGALTRLNLRSHPRDVFEHLENVFRIKPRPVMPLCPLMHGTGLLVSLLYLAQGAAVVTQSGRNFDPKASLAAMKKWRVSCAVIVGDAFADPLLRTLDDHRDQAYLEELRVLVSSGVSFADLNKNRFRVHQPRLIIVDNLGSSEASAYATATAEPGVFQPHETTRVLNEQLLPVEAGSNEAGMVYSGGYTPIGYYNEPEKSAETFVLIDGRRYTRTGDRCLVREDGLLVFLGRDNTVINSGGEKVFTVEVERALLEHPSIADVLVLGKKHARFGQSVCALTVFRKTKERRPPFDVLARHCELTLADYKVPREFIAVDKIPRGPNGKPDYAAARGVLESGIEA